MRIHARKISIPLKGDIYEQAPDGEDFAYWILDKKTFNDLWTEHNNIPDLNNKIKDLKKQRDDAIKERDEANQIANDNYEYVQQHKQDMENERKNIEKIKEQSLENQRDIESVLAIVRERANKERRIKDKKNSPGYIVKSSTYCDYRCGKSTTMMWKTTIQTPFFTEITKYKFWEYYNNDEFRKIYFDGLGVGEYNGDVNLNSKSDIEANSGNCYIDWSLNKNFKSGYWEITLIHYNEVVNT